MPRTTTLSKEELVSLCRMIGCSGMSPKTCPGDPDCDILAKIIGGDCHAREESFSGSYTRWLHAVTGDAHP